MLWAGGGGGDQLSSLTNGIIMVPAQLSFGTVNESLLEWWAVVPFFTNSDRLCFLLGCLLGAY